MHVMVPVYTSALTGETRVLQLVQPVPASLARDALRSAPELVGTPGERASRLYAHIEQIADPGVSIRIVDGRGRFSDAVEFGPYARLLIDIDGSTPISDS